MFRRAFLICWIVSMLMNCSKVLRVSLRIWWKILI